jgi:N-acetylglucosamine-6-sulfatase
MLMKRVASLLGASLVLVLVIVTLIRINTTVAHAAPGNGMNVVLIVADDQRWDKITPEFTPNIWTLAHQPGAIFFQNSFVSNPNCCPSRATTLTGQYSGTTGVWSNDPPYGGFSAFDDEHTLAVDFRAQGFRTALVGKYLNGYQAGRMTYVPPGWSKWFASNSGAYYGWSVTTKHGTKHFGNRPRDYSTRVLTQEALDFVAKGGAPFFLYFAPSAPHSPAIPDPRDVGRFSGEVDYRYEKARWSEWPSSSLESAYGVDRAVGHILKHVPPNTIVLYMSDNGYMWRDNSIHGTLNGKLWPYNEAIRVPMIYASLNGTKSPVIDPNTIVANVDLRDTLLHSAGLSPLTKDEGLDWFTDAPRDHLLIEHYPYPDYCGIRTKKYMYARFKWDDGYAEELYDVVNDPLEMSDLAATNETVRAQMAETANRECDPPPPDYSW